MCSTRAAAADPRKRLRRRGWHAVVCVGRRGWHVVVCVRGDNQGAGPGFLASHDGVVGSGGSGQQQHDALQRCRGVHTLVAGVLHTRGLVQYRL